jgi:hypothetical protein
MKPKIFLAILSGSILLAVAGVFSAPADVPSQVMLPAAGAGGGATDADALAKELSNPVASLISVPFQENFDFGYKGGGWESTLNIQPFYSYGAGKGRTYGVNFESTYDWRNSQSTIPLNLTVGQMLKLGEQRVCVTLGGRVYLDRPDGGPDWGLRSGFTLLFPE